MRTTALLLMSAANRGAAVNARAGIHFTWYHRIVNGILSTYPPGSAAQR